MNRPAAPASAEAAVGVATGGTAVTRMVYWKQRRIKMIETRNQQETMNYLNCLQIYQKRVLPTIGFAKLSLSLALEKSHCTVL